MNRNNFDFLRFLFASTVLLRHTIDLSQSLPLKSLEPYLDSHVSVMGFFIISGFLIWKSYATTKGLGAYLEKRARRLLPAYILFIILTTFGLSLVATTSFAQYFTNPSVYKYLLYNTFFLNFLQPCIPNVFDANRLCAVNGALWTIKVEVLFYLIVPLLFYLINRFDKKYIILALLYAASLAYRLYFESYKSAFGYTMSHQLPGLLTYFVGGISFFYYFDFYSKYKHYLIIPSLLLYVGETYMGIEILKPYAFACIVFYAAYEFSFFNNFGRKGDFSYGIYIYHFTIIQIIVQYGFFNRYNPYLVYVCVIILVVTIAVNSWYFIEKPFLKQKTIRLHTHSVHT